MSGRMVSANLDEGERFYLRVLLLHVKRLTGFNYLYTVNDVLFTMFRRATLERGLIKSDDHIHACLRESSTHEMPDPLRRLFATLLIYCEPGDVQKLWDDHYESLSEDYVLHCASVERVQNMVLTDISLILQSMGKSLSDFDLPNITANVRLYAFGCREVHEDCSIVVQEEDILAQHFLNIDQKNAYDTIMRHVDVDSPGVFFIDGPGGIGKTFLYKALLATVRSRAKLIIWDEASMAKGQVVEAVDQTMQDIIGVKVPFGGKIMVLGGDFRHVLPVIRRGTQAQIVDSSLRMSPLWHIIHNMRLTINMTAQTDPWFSNFLLRVGDEVEEVIEEDYVRIPDDMTILYTDEKDTKDALINEIFPLFATNVHSSHDIVSRAILSTKNDHVDNINDLLIDRFPGDEKVYYSFDEAKDDTRNLYPL
ncbi:ATP-dependent DNA helicase PIF1-like protein [Tanacetum coccineum]